MSANILITSAGKRGELVGEFHKELKTSFPDGKVLTTDLHPDMSPACHLSDGAFEICKVVDPAYPARLLEICKREGVKVVVPTIDTELEVLSRVREDFERDGIYIVVSDQDFIHKCRDKRLTNGLFDQLGIGYPEPRDIKAPIFPIFAKPYDGSLSKNLHILHSKADVTEEILGDDKLIFMELVDKSEFRGFTVDMYYGRDGKLKSIVPRERLEIRSGEINKGVSRKNGIVDYLYARMSEMPGVRGCICLQLFYSELKGRVLGIEINPRFGGGYPLSYYSGANFPRNIIEEYLKEGKVEYSDKWEEGTLMLRYDTQVITKI